MKGAFEIMTMGKPWRVGGEKEKSWAKETKRVFFVKKKGGFKFRSDQHHAARWIRVAGWYFCDMR
ncbi:MAG: hypothetical protein HIU90_15710 [Proteobacteria bacterium]|nr:hypothetical protein [Pseudomonadota bacterium]